MKGLQFFGRWAIAALFIISLGFSTVSPARADVPLPSFTQADDLLLQTPVETDYLGLDPGLAAQAGYRQVVIRLSAAPAGLAPDPASQRRQAAAVAAQQDEVINLVKAIDPGATVLGRTRMVLNAVMMEVDATKLAEIVRDARVIAINPVGLYEVDLSETVPYIGATVPVQAAGYSGRDVRVAVLDSGIDYTHEAFGGPGTLQAYLDAYGTSTNDPKNTTRDGLFPTARVVGGYDFVGEVWPNGPLAPDEDPIDCGPAVIGGLCAGGHGTHVADIIGGKQGVAPEVSLYAVKVCSAVSSSCSGVAILQGIDWSVDPDQNGDTTDHVDIINMSLGALYGQNYDNATAIAVDNATAIGILTVSSAGNSADKPYIVGTPSGARTALSVAQTEVPSAALQGLEVLTPPVIAGTYGAVFQPWSAPLTAVIEAPVQYGDGAGGNLLGCSAFAPGSLAGKIVLVDRGTCGFSVKISNIAAGGGLAGVIGLVAPGDPFEGGFGGGSPTVPGYMIRQADANRIKSQLAVGVTARLDPANRPSLVGTVVGSSSRGPTMGKMFYGNAVMYGQMIKPEIGAPGASVSAVAGSGTGTEAFGGTSGASPMVAGAAALIKNVNPFLSPQEIKTWLMNNAETNIMNKPGLFGDGLAPITRIGGGEVRVDRAAAAKAAAWESVSQIGALSFGFVDVTGVTKIKRTVVVKNYSDKAVTYTITPTFRFADDQATGAVSVDAPPSINVPKRSSKSFTVTLTIHGALLRDWGMNLGPQGGDATTLTTFEYDGYLVLTPNSGSFNNINLPWHVLPRKAANVTGVSTAKLNTPVTFTNKGVATAQVDTYALVGVNPFNLASGFAGEGQPVTVLKNIGYITYNGTGICPGNTFLMQFAIHAYQRSTTPETPYQAWVYIDADRDGVFDFAVVNADFTLNTLNDGRNLAWVVNLRTGSANAFFFTDHGSNTANLVLTICGSQLSDPTRPAALGGPIPAPSIGQPLDVLVQSEDNYFTGNVMSYIDGIVVVPGGERYMGLINDIPAGGSSSLTVVPTGVISPVTQSGVLLMFDGSRGGIKNGNPDGKEAIAVTVQP